MRGCPPWGGRTATPDEGAAPACSQAPGRARSAVRAARLFRDRQKARRRMALIAGPDALAGQRRSNLAKGREQIGQRTLSGKGGFERRELSPTPAATNREGCAPRSAGASCESVAIPLRPTGGRGPRSNRSSRRTCSSQPSRSSPALTSGCLSTASKATGANFCGGLRERKQ